LCPLLGMIGIGWHAHIVMEMSVPRPVLTRQTG
jgi:hypothetical protein